MRVFISIDMEGIAGIMHPRQVLRGNDDYERGRRLMTDEASAAVAGAFDAGATHVLVNDAHGDMSNLLPDRLDPRAHLLTGGPKGWMEMSNGMMKGITTGFDVCLFLGYHAGAGTAAANLEHTFAGTTVWDLRVNGQSWAEADFNAAIAGLHGVPLGMVTGDDKICAHVAQRMPWVRTVKVKDAIARNAAISVSPQESCRLISVATAGVLAARDKLKLFTPTPPYTLEMDVLLTAIADAAAAVPGCERTGPRSLRYQTDDFWNVMRVIACWTALGSGAAPRYAS